MRSASSTARPSLCFVRVLYVLWFILLILYVQWGLRGWTGKRCADENPPHITPILHSTMTTFQLPTLSQNIPQILVADRKEMVEEQKSSSPVQPTQPDKPKVQQQQMLRKPPAPSATTPTPRPPPGPFKPLPVSPQQITMRNTLSEFLAGTAEDQSTRMLTRLEKPPVKKWSRYHLESFSEDVDVFNDVCYEYSSNAKSFKVKHWFKNGEDNIFNGREGTQPGEGGRHAILDQGIAPTTSTDKMHWSHPATEGQDLLVLSLLDNKQNGFFVDLAARYWHRGSNSFHLENYYHWNGICVEPDNNFARGLTLNRTCLVICNNPVSDANGGTVRFNYKINGANSKGNEDGVKTMVTLTTILNSANAPRHIDYVSLDVEDHEWAVLSKFDFSKYRFTVMTIERPVIQLHKLLTTHGYRWLTQLPGNFGETVYVHESIDDLAGKMNSFRKTASHKWRREIHAYLLEPKWDSTTGTFRMK